MCSRHRPSLHASMSSKSFNFGFPQSCENLLSIIFEMLRQACLHKMNRDKDEQFLKYLEKMSFLKGWLSGLSIGGF